MLYKHGTPLIALLCALLLMGCGSGREQQEETGIDKVAVAYVQRIIPLDEEQELIYPDHRRPYQFIPGAALYIKDQADATLTARNITQGLFPEGELYDVRDLAASYDGQKLLFALRAPEIEDADDDEQPTWNIWQYDLNTGHLNRIIASDLQAEAGQDYAPQYLADGRIVFLSTRQRDINAIRLDEGKPQFSALDERRDNHAAVLHVMNADGTDIKQISFNMSHDYSPKVLDHGKIVFSRWDNAGGRNQINLYTINPDGTDLQLLYGAHSHDQGSDNTAVHFIDAKPLSNGRLLARMSPLAPETWGSNWQIIDSDNFTDHDTLTANGRGDNGQEDFFPFNIPTTAGFNRTGRYLDISPLANENNRYLVSWNPCRLRKAGQAALVTETALPCTADNITNANAEEAYPNAGIWIYDARHNTQKPISLPPAGFFISEVTSVAHRSTPQWLADQSDGSSYGVLAIKSVYDIDGRDTAPGGIAALRDPAQTDFNTLPARFIRIVKAVGIPDRDTFQFNGTAFGASQFMRQIVGYAPIEPDGSVSVKVPANIPFTLSVVDDQGQRIGGRHNVWLQLRAGETLQCVGCHASNNSKVPHGRYNAQLASINPGAPVDSEVFPNTVDHRLALFGETMAETLNRIEGPRELSPDLIWQDDWTDPTNNDLTPAQSIDIVYRDSVEAERGLQTAIPTTDSCLDVWGSFCRITIHYEQHIQPIWEKERLQYDVDGITVLSDHTCTSCHTREDAAGQLQVPPAQLELTRRASENNNRYFISYTDLLVQNLEQEIIDGALQNRTREVPVLDDDGEPLLDEGGAPIIRIDTFPVTLTMRSAGARSSNRFFDKLHNADDSVHYQQLSPIELKLLREWLDIGAQYYNNPFEAPQ